MTATIRRGAASRQVAVPVRSARRVISYAAFLAAVRDMAPLATIGEAEHSARGILSQLGGCLSWGTAQDLAGQLPKPLCQLVRARSFGTSMSRFAPQAFLAPMAEEVGAARAAQNVRAVLRTLDLILPKVLTTRLHGELASLWGPLAQAGDDQPSHIPGSRSASVHAGPVLASL